VLDVVKAIDGEEPAFRCTEIRQRGPLGTPARDCVRPCGVAQVMATAEAAWRDALASVSIADLATGLDVSSAGQALPAIATWLRAS
jgi:DNA-binding IscR family transcriptional regulator